MANNISLSIGYKIDQSSLNQVKKSIAEIRRLSDKDLLKINPNLGSQENAAKKIVEIRKTAADVEMALEKAFNPKINSINVSKFNEELKKSNLLIKKVYKNFEVAGAVGRKAFMEVYDSISRVKLPIKETNKALEKMGETLANTVKWTISSYALGAVTNSLSEAIGYVKALDKSLNNIRIVTGKSAEEMAAFAKEANSAAKSLGTGTKNYSNAALTFYQQGLKDEDVKARTNTSIKVANVSGLSGDTASEYVTSVVNGYKVAAREVENAMDKLSAVGAATASDLAELSEGMSKVASTANAMGVSEDQLAATLSTVISVTRQDAATIGTAFKTIYARISDIEAGSADAEVSLGEYTSQMEKLGFSVLDQNHKLKDLGTVMEEIGGSWSTLSREQQIALAQTMAGTRQYNNLIALFDNWNEYTKALNVSLNANGTLQEQQNTYMESTAAHMKELQAEAEDLYDSLFNADVVNGFTDALKGLVFLTRNWVDSIGGGGNTLLTLGSIATRVFSDQIGKNISRTIRNYKNLKLTVEEITAALKVQEDVGKLPDEDLREIAKTRKAFLENRSYMTEDDKAVVESILQRQTEAYAKKQDKLEEKKVAQEAAQRLGFVNPQTSDSYYGNEYDQLREYVNNFKKVKGSKVVRTKEVGKFLKQLADDKNSQISIDDSDYQDIIDEIDNLKSTDSVKINDQKAKEINQKIQKYLLAKNLKKYEKEIFGFGEIDFGKGTEITEDDSALEKLTEIDTSADSVLKALQVIQTKTGDLKEKISESKAKEMAESIVGETDETSSLLSSLETPLGKEVTNSYKELFTEIQKTGKISEEQRKQLLEFFTTIKKVGTDTKAALKPFDEAAGNIQEEIDKINREAQNLNQSFNTQKLISGVVNLTGSIGQLASVYQSFLNLGSLWKDEDVSTGEKILQTILNLSTAIPMLISGGKGVKDSISGIWTALGGLQKVTLAQIATTEGLDLAQKANINTSELHTVAEWKDIAAKKGLIAANGEEIISDQAVGAARWASLGPLALIAAAIAAIVAISAVLIIKINEENKARERLNERVIKTKEAYEDATTAAENLKTTISSYTEAVKSLETINSSTLEFKDSLEETNKKAKELIETYGLLDDQYYYNSKGIITFNKGVLENLQAIKEQNIRDAQVAQADAQKTLSQKDMEEESAKVRLTFDYNNSNPNTSDPFHLPQYKELAKEYMIKGYREATKIQLSDVEYANLKGDPKFLAGSTGIKLFSDNYNNFLDRIEEKVKESPELDSKEILKEVLNEQKSVLGETFEGFSSYINNSKEALTAWTDSLKTSEKALDQFSKQILGAIVEDEFSESIKRAFTSKDSSGEEVVDEGKVNLALEGVKTFTENQPKAEDFVNILTQEQNEAFSGLFNNKNDALDIYQLVTRQLNAEQYGWESLEKTGTFQALEQLAKGKTNFSDRDLIKAYLTMTQGISEGDADTAIQSIKDGTATVKLNGKNVDFGISDIANNFVSIMKREAGQAKFEQSDVKEKSQDFLATQEKLLKQGNNNRFGIDWGSVIASNLANGNLDTFNLSEILPNLSKSEWESLKSGKTTLQELAGLSDEEIQTLGLKNADAFQKAFENGLASWSEKNYKEEIQNAANEAFSQAQKVLDKVVSGDLTFKNISSDEDFTKLQNQLNQLKKEYPELESKVELLNNTALTGTNAYIQNLKEIEDIAGQAKIEQKVDEISDKMIGLPTFVDIDIKADTSDFEKTIDEILGSQYKIDVQIHSNAEKTFDEVSNKISDMEDKAALIGEGFITSADDLRELNQAFPGVLEGMEYLSDGTIKLNQDIVQSAMESAQAEAQAEAQSTIEKLQNQATVLRAKQATYKKMADAALVLAKNESSTDEQSAQAKAELSAGLADLQAENAQLTDQAISTGSYNTSKDFSTNWQNAYRGVNQVAYDTAKAQLQYTEDVASGKVKSGELKKAEISKIEYAGSNSVSEGTSDIMEQVQDALTTNQSKSSEFYNQLAENLIALYDASGASAADIEGQIAQVAAMANASSINFSTIATGAGKNETGSAEVLDFLESALDLYQQIDREIENISRELDRLSDLQEKLTGKALQDNLDKQLETLKKQEKAYEKKLELAKTEAAIQAATLKGYGITFDKNGNINNYAEVYNSRLNSINSQIAAYNSLGKGYQTEEMRDSIDQAKEELDKIKDLVSNYNKVIPDVLDELDEISNKEFEIKIEKLEVAIEEATTRVDWSKAFDEYLNAIGFKSDDIVGKTQLIAQSQQSKDYLIKQMQAQYEGATAAERAINVIDSGQFDKIYGNDRAKALENAKSYGEDLMQNIQEIYSTLESLNEQVLSGISEVKSAYSDLNSIYSDLNSTYKTASQLIKLIYGEKDYTSLDNYYQKQQQVYNQQLVNLRKEQQYWKDLMNTVEENSDEWKSYKDNFVQVSQELNSTLSDSIQNIIDTYKNSINKIFQTLENNLTSGKGLSYINDEWTLLKDNANQYLDAVNAAYNIEETKSKYLDAINSADDEKVQQRINDLMDEQLKKLKEKDKLTKYDVERSQKLLDLELKRIALEEAQQNKSKMRLRRNSTGDYTYEFVADEDQVSKAQQDLQKAENDLYNFDLDEYNNSLDRAYQLYSEYQQKVMEVYTNTSLSQEERDTQLHLLNEQYNESIAQLIERNTTSRVNLEESANETVKSLYKDNTEAFQGMIDENGNLIMNQLVPGWNSGVQNMIDKIAGEGGLDQTMQETLGKAETAVEDLSEKEQEAAQTAGLDLEDLKNANLELADILSTDVVNAQEKVLEKSQAELDSIKSIRTEYQDWAKDILNSVIPAYDTLIDKINDSIKKVQELAAVQGRDVDIDTTGLINKIRPDGKPTPEGGNGKGNSSDEPNGAPYKQRNQVNPQIYDPLDHQYEKIRISSIFHLENRGKVRRASNSNASDVSWIASPTTQLKLIGISEGNYPLKVAVKDKPNQVGWIRNNLGAYLDAYDTGGYTGSWGADGRIAMLHQKELVLNAKDTENMLNAVQILRTITENLDNSFMNMLADIPDVSKLVTNKNQDLKQKVYIQASFPNVKDSNEIEKALNNLTNVASQRILTNKK